MTSLSTLEPLSSNPLWQSKARATNISQPALKFAQQWCHNGRKAIAANLKGFLNIFDFASSEPEASKAFKKVHEQSVSCLRLADRHGLVVSSDKSGLLKVNSLGFNNELKERGSSSSSSADNIRSFTLSPNERKLASAHEDKSVRVWDFSTLEVERRLEGHGSDVVTIDWHPSKALLVSGGKDRLLKFWDPLTGKNICNLFNHTNTINKVRFNRNENFLVSSGKDQLVRVFDVRVMREFAVLKGHDAEVTDIEWHPIYENHLVSADVDSKVCYWVLPFSAPVSAQVHQKGFGVVRSAFDPYGHFVASVANDRQMKLWEVNEQPL